MKDQFVLKFNSLPGDTSLFPVANRGGAVANDGVIGCLFGTHCINGVDDYASELGNFWPHLYQSGNLQKDFPILRSYV